MGINGRKRKKKGGKEEEEKVEKGSAEKQRCEIKYISGGKTLTGE